MRTLKYTKTASRKTRINGQMQYEIYDCRIWLDDKLKQILKIDCSCWNFQNRQIRKVGKVHNIKFIGSPCKHLKPAVEPLLSQGYNFKPINEGGLDKCTPALKKQILEVWGNKCFIHNCKIKENLTFHRLNRGNAGGKYSILNVRPLCIEHNKLIHGNEFK